MKELLIRVSSDAKSGRGHLTRCLNIRKFINARVIWYVDKCDQNITSLIPKKDRIFFENDNTSCSLLEKCNFNKKKVLLIDSYNISLKKKEELMSYFDVVTIEDKLVDLKVKLLICPQPVEKKSNSNKELIGIKYAPIFIKSRKKRKNKGLFNILINLGAYDSKGITLKAIKAVKKLKKIKNKVFTYILVTKYFPFIKIIEDNLKNDKNFKVIVDKKNIIDVANNCDLAIGAPGISHLERLALGIPTVLLAQNIKQTNLVEFWSKKKCAILANNSVQSIFQKVLYLMDDKSVRDLIIKNGKKNIDGLGAKRIAEKINLI